MITTVEQRLRRIEQKSVAFKVPGADIPGGMDKVQAAHGDSDASGPSDLGALEDETDDFGRRILQHHRDTQRLDSALRKDGQPFRKQQPRPRLPRPRLPGLHGIDGSQAGHGHGRTGSGGSSGSDPPLNVPSQWGRRARRQAGWLRELRESINMDPPDSRAARKEDMEAISAYETRHTGEHDWEAIADQPLASIEDTPPSMKRHRADTTPSSLRHTNTMTLPGATALDDPDFSTVDLLASTPAVNRRNRRVDLLTKRGTEHFEQRRITKHTLKQALNGSGSAPVDERPVTAPPRTSPSPPRQPGHLNLNKENVAPNSDVQNGYHAEEVKGRASKPLNFKRPTTHSVHSRNDSYNLLKQLVRVSSSPSPGKDKAEREVLQKRKETRLADVLPLSARSTNSDYISTEKPSDLPQRQPYPASDAEHEDLEPSSRKLKERPIVDATPAMAEQGAEVKTPVVTGAWVDTPGGKQDRETAVPIRQKPAEETVEQPLRRVHSEPGQGKSALADVLKDMKAQPNALYGDTTMQSLEDIVNPNVEPSDPELTNGHAEAAADQRTGDRELTQAEKDRRQERLAIEAMNKHLRAARTSIKDANRGLRRVENKIEGTDAGTSAPAETSKVAASASQSKSTTSGKTVCEHCGGTYRGSVWKALWIEFRSNFYIYPGETPPAPAASPEEKQIRWWQNKYIHLTTLGLAVTLVILYATVELWLCDIYCHKRYATTMVGFGVDPNAPIFPFVIPTLLSRPFRALWQPVVDCLSWLIAGCWRWLTETEAPPKVVKSGGSGGRIVDKSAQRGWNEDFGGTTITKAFTNTAWEQVGKATAVAGQQIWSGMQQKYDDADSMWHDESI